MEYLKCPFCGFEETIVADSRDSEDLNAVRRRRECTDCGKRFTTYERTETTILVKKKDGRREYFDRAKLVRGIERACEKRTISSDEIQAMVSEVERELLNKESAEVSTKEIGEIVMRVLKKRDKVAYIRFASVYKEFEDVKRFEKEISKLTR
ncbi:MAG: transcriptional regulator NrdR [Candidatus Micrarchaeota archaeon]